MCIHSDPAALHVRTCIWIPLYTCTCTCTCTVWFKQSKCTCTHMCIHSDPAALHVHVWFKQSTCICTYMYIHSDPAALNVHVFGFLYIHVHVLHLLVRVLVKKHPFCLDCLVFSYA